MSRFLSGEPERESCPPPDAIRVSDLPLLLEHVRLLIEILLEEQELLLSGRPEELEEVLSRKVLQSDRFSELLERSGLAACLSRSEKPFLSEPEGFSCLSELRANLVHLSEIASVNLVIARESAQTVAGFLKALRQCEGDFETYGSRGVPEMTLGSPSLVSTRR
ncbi:MAG: hypothetical protein M1297_10510 [Nitrospirae bacterium]|jgi:hypothetical protein|nr:hypothetical protein [Nitrospirota bacterium]